MESTDAPVPLDEWCDRLLECLDAPDPLDASVYDTLVVSDYPLTVDDLARRTRRTRSAVYDSVRRLTDGGLVTRARMVYGQGGHSTVYEAVGPERVADALSRGPDDRCARIDRRLVAFRDASADDSAATGQ
jgi:predicted transcriptional regulator